MVSDEPVTTITVFLADDNLIVREGVAALLRREKDLEIVGVAENLGRPAAGRVRARAAGARHRHPHAAVVPRARGSRRAKVLRRHHPGTVVVILSQYDEPEYAISLLGDGAAGFGYLLKDRVAEGDQLARAIRTVATGGSARTRPS